MLPALMQATFVDADTRPLDEIVIEALVTSDAIAVNPHDQVQGEALALVRTLFTAEKPVRSVFGWARAANTSTRTLGRRIAWAGFPPPAAWTVLACMLRAQRTLQHYGKANRAAHAAGYTNPFTYSNQMSRVLGCRPTEVRHLSPVQLMGMWIERMRPRFGAPLAKHGRCPFCKRMMD